MGSDKNYVAELFDLTDRVVLVTGGSRGLGREMAFAAAHCGADVIIASRKFDACLATAEEIGFEAPVTAVFEKLYAEAADHGLQDLDLSSLFVELASRNGMS